jgi:hypothetical protein
LILGAFRAKVLGCTLKEYLTDGKKLAEGTLAAYERFRHDAVEISWDIMMEAETAGAELEYPDDSIPQIKRHVLAEKRNLGKLAIPDPEKAGVAFTWKPAGRLAGAQPNLPGLDRTLDRRPASGTQSGFSHHRRPGFRRPDGLHGRHKPGEAETGLIYERRLLLQSDFPDPAGGSSSPITRLVRFRRKEESMCGGYRPIMEDLVNLGSAP